MRAPKLFLFNPAGQSKNGRMTFPNPQARPRFHALRRAFVIALFTVCVGTAAAARVELVAGGGANTNVTDALRPTDARLSAPFGVEFDGAGNLYIVEMTGQRVRRLGTDGLLRVVAGTGAKGGGDGRALEAQFNGIHNLAMLGGDVLLADTWNHSVRAFSPANGTVQRRIGSGEKGFSGDGGPAERAAFGGIYCVSVGLDGLIYLADLDNHRIRRVSPADGRVQTVAGNGRKGVPQDGARAVEAPLNDPRAVIADAQGRIYILERGGHALRCVETNGGIRSLAGTGQKGHSGDGGPAGEATLNGPKHLCFDRDGNVLIADTENHVIRRYDLRSGTITRVVGSGQKGRRGVGGPALEVELNQPHGVYVHHDGTLYISDSSNHRILKVTP